jgi:hypothetical protein
MANKPHGYMELTIHKLWKRKRPAPRKRKRPAPNVHPPSTIHLASLAAKPALGGKRPHGFVGSAPACAICGLPNQSPVHKTQTD